MTQVEGPRAELESIRETADLIAHDGLQPGSDGFRVMAGLVSQLANQTERLLDAELGPEGGSDQRSQKPDQREASKEEDVSPEDAPAEPPRDI